MQAGIFLMHAKHYITGDDAESILANDRIGVVGMDHAVVFNAGTRVLMLYPESIVITDEDLEDLEVFRVKLLDDQHKLRMVRPGSAANIRLLCMRVNGRNAQARIALTSYNTPGNFATLSAL